MNCLLRELYVCVGAVAFFAAAAEAGSLADAIAKQEAMNVTVSESLLVAKAGHFRYNVDKVVLASSLALPDAMSRTTLSPEDGRLVVLVQGRAINEGVQKVNYTCPQLIASDGSKHDVVKHLFYKRGGDDSLNPMECYPFVACYFIFPNMLKGCQLLFSDGEWFNTKTAAAAIPFDDSTNVEDIYTLYQVTDNQFDVESVPNKVDETAADGVAQAQKEEEEKKAREAAKRAREEAEQRMLEMRLRQAQSEFESALREAESDVNSLESELRQLDFDD